MSTLDKSTIEQMQKDYQYSNMTIKEIAKKYEISVGSIYNHCKNFRRYNSKTSVKPEILQAIEEYQNTNIPVDQIIKKYKITESTLYYHTDYRRGDANKGRKYSLNEKKLMIDSHEKFYWLGFIAADGCINDNRTLTIELKNIDRKHLQKFCEFLETDKPIIDRINNLKVECSKIVINSVNLVKFLEQYNIVPRKSQIFVIPKDKIPDYYLMDFLRGMIDGDGCIRINNHQQISLSFCSGNQICCQQMASLLGIKNQVSFSGNVWRFQVTGNIKAKKILDNLYKNSSNKTRLERKYNIYRSLIK